MRSGGEVCQSDNAEIAAACYVWLFGGFSIGL
jgi:hypothetical protein